MKEIFIDGDFNDGYESRVRRSKGDKKHRSCPIQKGYWCFDDECNKGERKCKIEVKQNKP